MKLLRPIKTVYELWEDVDPGLTLTMISLVNISQTRPGLCIIISSCYFITNHDIFPNSSPPISPAWVLGLFCSLTLETVAERKDVSVNIFSFSAPLRDHHHHCLSQQASPQKSSEVLWIVQACSARTFGHPIQGTRIQKAFRYPRN